MKLIHKGLLLIAAPVFLQIALLAGLASLLSDSNKDIEEQLLSKQIVLDTMLLGRLEADGYFLSIASGMGGGQTVVDGFFKKRRELHRVSKELLSLVAFDKDRLPLIKTLTKLLQKLSDQLKEVVEKDEASRLFVGSRDPLAFELFEQIRSANSMMDKIIDREGEIETRRSARKEKSRRLIEQLLKAGVFINSLGALLISLYFYKGISARLQRIFENTNRLSRREPLSPALSGGDEIAAIDKSFHQMADTLKINEQRIQAVLEKMSVGIVVVDIDTMEIESINQALEDTLAVSRQSVVGKSVCDLIDLDTKDAPEILKDLCQSGRSIKLQQTGPGSSKDLELTAALDRIQDRSRVIICVRDITREVESERMKRQFLAMITHEIKTPLSSTTVFLDLLQNKKYTEDHNKLSERAKMQWRSVDRIRKLVNDLLEIEKMESDQLFLELMDEPLEDVISDSIEAVIDLANEASVSIEYHVEPPGLSFRADTQRLTQVFVYLRGIAI